MPRYVSACSTPVFLFNMAGLAVKLVSSLACLSAAICHALGLPGLDLALDIMVATIAIGLAHSAIWLIVRIVFGIETETAAALKAFPGA